MIYSSENYWIIAFLCLAVKVKLLTDHLLLRGGRIWPGKMNLKNKVKSDGMQTSGFSAACCIPIEWRRRQHAYYNPFFLIKSVGHTYFLFVSLALYLEKRDNDKRMMLLAAHSAEPVRARNCFLFLRTAPRVSFCRFTYLKFNIILILSEVYVLSASE